MSSSTVSIAQALQLASRQGLSRLEAQLVLMHALRLQSPAGRTWLLTHDDLLLSESQLSQVKAMFYRLYTGEPWAYIIGEKEFHGLMLNVSPDVLVPRPDTEILVEWALDAIAHLDNPRVLDLGTGSGAIALAIKNQRPDVQMVATDRSPKALEMARSNAHQHQLNVAFLQGSWWEALPPIEPSSLGFDLIVSNPPYIREDDPHLEHLQHEPQTALVAAASGLADLEHLIAHGQEHLNPDCFLLLEHGWDQSKHVAVLFDTYGWWDIQHRQDLGGHVRCTGARKPSLTEF